MSNYETSLKASLDNLSDDEISKQLKTGYFSDESQVIAAQVLSEREFGDNKSIVKEQAHQTEFESPAYLSSEQNKKYIKGKVIVWMVTLFLIGAGFLDTTSKNKFEFYFFNGLVCAFIGTIIHLIYINVKKRDWTTAELKKTYQRNFVGALVVIGITFISKISRINLDTFPAIAWLDLVVLSIIFMMFLKSKKLANHVFAIYCLIPIATDFVFVSNDSTMIWAFGFLVSAKSILISEVINPESSESTNL